MAAFVAVTKESAFNHDVAAAAALRALGVAAEHGWTATKGPRDAWYVPSASRVRTARCVEAVADATGLLWLACSCEGGYYRPGLPVACWHGAAVATAMYEDGWLRCIDGLFYRRDRRRSPNGRFM